MAYWIFKIANQKQYRNELGIKYVFDNTHSIRVAKNDVFIYLNKSEKYSFTATGVIQKLTKRKPSDKEAKRDSRIKTIYTAFLKDVLWFKKPLSISPQLKQGKQNRAYLGIADVNALGWSQSISFLNEELYQSILDLCEIEISIPDTESESEFEIPDSWGKTRIRKAMKKFSSAILDRSNSSCVVCGSSLPGLIDAAHLSPYSTDKKNRANPANGIALCKYCHRAFDLRLIAIQADGILLLSEKIKDEVACFHFSKIAPAKRLKWLKGVDKEILKKTVSWYHKVNL